MLAYTFGMRRAFDADHISAIDNTTRPLMAEGRRRPMSVGFFFSLRHSTPVLGLSLAIAFFDELERQLNNPGLMFRLFGPLARAMDRRWRMHPLAGAATAGGFASTPSSRCWSSSPPG